MRWTTKGGLATWLRPFALKPRLAYKQLKMGTPAVYISPKQKPPMPFLELFGSPGQLRFSCVFLLNLFRLPIRAGLGFRVPAGLVGLGGASSLT